MTHLKTILTSLLAINLSLLASAATCINLFNQNRDYSKSELLGMLQSKVESSPDRFEPRLIEDLKKMIGEGDQEFAWPAYTKIRVAVMFKRSGVDGIQYDPKYKDNLLSRLGLRQEGQNLRRSSLIVTVSSLETLVGFIELSGEDSVLVMDLPPPPPEYFSELQ